MASFFNRMIVGGVQLMPKSTVRLFANRYIAGDELVDAVDAARELNKIGICATIDVLGEAVTNKEEAVAAKNDCIQVLEAATRFRIDSNLSIKPTQLGLGIDEEFCLEQVLEITEKAKEINCFVRIDMEDSPYTTKTFDLLKKVKEKYDNVGVVVQAYLHRTYDDVTELNKIGVNYRLCKGIYIEPESIAYKDKKEIRDNYLKILESILGAGNYVGIATHDDYLLYEAKAMLRNMNVQNDKSEFQMLLGVREDLRDEIKSEGYKIRIYIPFGSHWYQYSVRRLKENPEVAGYIFKNILAKNRK
jgi:proline dehydrogenase